MTREDPLMCLKTLEDWGLYFSGEPRPVFNLTSPKEENLDYNPIFFNT